MCLIFYKFEETIKPNVMKNRLYLFIILLLLFSPILTFAQFSVSAELRPRFEMDNGALKPHPDTVDALYFVSQRSRLKFDFAKEKYQLRLTIQDVRFWGSGDIYTSTGLWGSTAGLDIQEAWVRLKLCDDSKITIGRQVLQFDDQRLISGRNWNQFGIAYDAVNYTLTRNKWNLNVAVSYNTNTYISNGKVIKDEEFFNAKNIMKSFNFIHLSRAFNEHFQASVMAVGAAYQSSKSASVLYMTGTYGFWVKYNKGIFDIAGNIYYQNGKAQTGKEVSAYMATVHPGVKVGAFRIGLGGDYISGDNAENDDYGTKERTFNKMYGAVFKYYGFMNYYTYMKASTANGGLTDIYPNVKATFNKKHTILLSFHKFYLSNPVLIKGEPSSDQDLGSELDLMYTYKPMKELSLQAGFSYYFTTETLEGVKNVQASDIHSPYWGWVMLTFTPKLFTSK